ncbi:flagellar basal body-associated FliL family protein [Rhizobium sp. LC145]|uniref:flagellar basal body-associated FliL family protein n=1 Tax=Rhizobium sp. LC145 TaxID=1120688 RepID=UPI00062A165D|nr:flagellar basal body-associated FliL family protein [Rhizobium sp. LC145]KKX23676.1 flagellar basal body protein FliL [Rhizobium sp. LC145]TKT58979.1 flagellar basal body-associated FliL family protein [Rhizobiaceae bacterium LC148]
MAEEAISGGSNETGRSPLVMMIAGLAVLTLVGAGGGWLVGGLIAPALPEAAAPSPQTAAGGQAAEGNAGIPHLSAEANGIVALDPITTNLAYPAENWIRLEVALAFKGPPEAALAEVIHQDILAYLRTVSLQQIEGPRGFQYLKDDIQERVDLRSQGKITKVLFRTFVIE